MRQGLAYEHYPLKSPPMLWIKTDLDAKVLALALTVVPDVEVFKAYEVAGIKSDTRAMVLCATELRNRSLLQ